MYNKLSFIPMESNYPLNMSIEDFENIASSGLEKEIITSGDTLVTQLVLNMMFGWNKYNGTYCKMEDIIERTKECKCFDLNVVHGDTNDKIALQYAFQYVCRIIAIGDGIGISSMAEKEDLENKESFDCNSWPLPYDNFYMFSLLKQIPIWLVEECQMPAPPIGNDYSTELLGCYFSSHEWNNDYPVIFICPKRIEEAINSLKYKPGLENISTTVLFAKVLVHELAHAIMDQTNKLDGRGFLVKYGQQQKKSEADLFMEESLANMITLQYFAAVKDKIDNDDYAIVKEIMNHQPNAYRFGIAQYEQIHTNWTLWRNNKSNIKFWVEWGTLISPMKENLKIDYPYFL